MVYITKFVNYSFEETIKRVTESLKMEGFGIITEIDVTKTLKDKIDVDFRKYRILGACNPHFAHKVLQAEDKLGGITALQCSGPGTPRWQSGSNYF